jgi:hypothetical protein
MRFSKQVNGLALAVAAAAVFATVPMSASADEGAATKGHCVGANACKGQSACAGADNACAGKNACKGKGFTEMTAEECTKAGGKFEEPKSTE